MPNREHPENAPPPGSEQRSDNRADTARGQGYKYMLVKTVLKVEPSQWIAQRRTPASGSKRPGMSYAQIAEEMNAALTAANVPVRLTHESMRRWDPEGEFVRSFDDDDETAADPPPEAVPPAIFRTPGEAA